MVAGVSLPNPASLSFHEKFVFRSVGVFRCGRREVRQILGRRPVRAYPSVERVERSARGLKSMVWPEGRMPAAFYTGGRSRALASPRTSVAKRDQIAVSDRRTLGGLTQFLTQFGVSGSATGP